ncbi:MBL fold metallo-hydrolase [bacterium]|nr:MBL fold metallo-hydrolase [bacterium]
MKKSKKRIVYAIVLVFILIALPLASYMYKFKSETDSMRPEATKQIVPRVYAVKDGFVNLYLIKSDGRYIAIDAGNDPKVVLEEMATLSIDPALVDAVFLTHSDGDHTGALDSFKNATVHLPELEEQLIDGSTSRFLFFGNKLDKAHTLLKDNQTLTIGNLSIRCVSTPGHTPGSMSYVINDMYLFMGDSMSLKDGKAGLFNDTFNMDNDIQRESLKRLAKLNTITHVFTAHYGYSDNFKKVFEDFSPL